MLYFILAVRLIRSAFQSKESECYLKCQSLNLCFPTIERTPVTDPNSIRHLLGILRYFLSSLYSITFRSTYQFRYFQFQSYFNLLLPNHNTLPPLREESACMRFLLAYIAFSFRMKQFVTIKSEFRFLKHLRFKAYLHATRTTSLSSFIQNYLYLFFVFFFDMFYAFFYILCARTCIFFSAQFYWLF